MVEPLIFVSTYELKEGKLEAYKEAARDWFEWNAAEHPRLLLNEVYASEDGAALTAVQVHPDSDSMVRQMEIVADVHSTWQETIDWSTMRIELLGSPSEELLKRLRQVAGSGVPVTIKSPVDGFSRLPAG